MTTHPQTMDMDLRSSFKDFEDSGGDENFLCDPVRILFPINLQVMTPSTTPRGNTNFLDREVHDLSDVLLSSADI